MNESVFYHCVVSLNQCSNFMTISTSLQVVDGYGMSRKLVQVCHNWNKLFLCSVTKLR